MLKATFVQEKETHNTIRFQEVEGEQPPIMGTAYVQKWALRKLCDGVMPQKITITIEVVEKGE